MSSFNRWAAGVAAAFACGTAFAGMHQICYEGTAQLQGTTWVSTGVFGCATDAGSCRITPLSGAMRPRNGYPLDQGVQSQGSFAYYDFNSTNGTGIFPAKVEFFDANSVKTGERTCTVRALGVLRGGPYGSASPGAVLTGFTTDVSGLVTTGIWRLFGAKAAPWRRLAVQAPGDFVAVGGGAVGTEVPSGAMVIESMRYQIYAGDARSWRASTSEASNVAEPHVTTGYVIGMHVEGIDAATLATLVQPVDGSTFPTIAATSSKQVLAGSTAPVVLSGGVQAWADASTATNMIGQLLTQTAPVVTTWLDCTVDASGFFRCKRASGVAGWSGSSKDHVISRPGYVNVQVLGLPSTLTINGVAWSVRSTFVQATSAVAAHPAVDVGGLRGNYALTGIGATVGATTAGNLLWKLEPRADLGGASVASKDHVVSSPAAITGFAIGIKLVPPGTP